MFLLYLIWLLDYVNILDLTRGVHDSCRIRVQEILNVPEYLVSYYLLQLFVFYLFCISAKITILSIRIICPFHERYEISKVDNEKNMNLRATKRRLTV